MKIGKPQQHEGLTLFPLFPANPASELIGAKQNRATNRTILVAAGRDTPDADAFLAAVRSARRHPMATAGKGTYATLAGDVVGGELAVGGDTVHLCAFPAD